MRPVGSAYCLPRHRIPLKAAGRLSFTGAARRIGSPAQRSINTLVTPGTPCPPSTQPQTGGCPTWANVLLPWISHFSAVARQHPASRVPCLPVFPHPPPLLSPGRVGTKRVLRRPVPGTEEGELSVDVLMGRHTKRNSKHTVMLRVK